MASDSDSYAAISLPTLPNGPQLTLHAVILSVATQDGIGLADVNSHENPSAPGSLSFTLLLCEDYNEAANYIARSNDCEPILDDWITRESLGELTRIIRHITNRSVPLHQPQRFRGSFWACDWRQTDLNPPEWTIDLMPSVEYEAMMKERRNVTVQSQRVSSQHYLTNGYSAVDESIVPSSVP